MAEAVPMDKTPPCLSFMITGTSFIFRWFKEYTIIDYGSGYSSS